MTETTDSIAAPESAGSRNAGPRDTGSDSAGSAAPARKAGGLSGMLLPELKKVAGGLGIKATGLKKADLVAAIRAAQSSNQSSHQSSSNQGANQGQQEGREKVRHEARDRQQRAEREQGTGRNHDEQPRQDAAEHRETGDRGERTREQNRGEQQARGEQNRGEQQSRGDQNRGEQQSRGDQSRGEQRENQGGRSQGHQAQGHQAQGHQTQGGGQGANRDANRDEDGGSRRNRRRRGRDRVPGQTGGTSSQVSRGGRNEPDLQILEDDVLTPCAGILDVLDNYAFVRTSGYLPGTEDVYVSLSMVRKYGLRRGDAITGQVRQPREGERKEKFNPLVVLDTVNGADPEAAKDRVEFSKLTPLYASERLRLETTPTNLIGRVIDIAAPIGKGQRGLIVSPAKAGKTMIMQSIANSITTNNPECHLMVVLVDERPEEVTDFERSVKGEVISSTFDRPATDHTMVAELAIERAKRLVELGHDVVVLLDGITRLGRAYNLAAPPSGRILSGGVDSAALYPPKKFFGAARNIEDGGSLTILATALIESGSKMDEVIFEEFKGTGNMEIRLRRDFADKRIFPAIDAVQSGTRREELLMSKEELAIVWKLRRVLSALDGQQALELLLERLKKSQTNLEFLMQVQKTTPTAGGQEA